MRGSWRYEPVKKGDPAYPSNSSDEHNQKEGRPKTKIAAREQISRKTVRRWQRRYDEHGDNWLFDRVPRRPPAMPNQTPLEVELAIVDYALDHPEAASAVERLDRDLATEGITRIGRVLTDNWTEFVGKPTHAFKALCARLGAKHRQTRVRHVWTNGKAERFVQTLKDALEGMLRKKHYGTVAELQADLDRWLAWYNIQRPHRDRHNRGRSPLQVIREFRIQQVLKAA